MKMIVVLAALVAIASARPQADKDATITKNVNSNYDNAANTYEYAYDTSNGISAAEKGQLKNPGPESGTLEVQGQYSYVGPDGVTYSISYIANENGFQPNGAHLPVAPS